MAAAAPAGSEARALETRSTNTSENFLLGAAVARKDARRVPIVTALSPAAHVCGSLVQAVAGGHAIRRPPGASIASALR
jgi:hypothetical protein